MSHLPFKKVKPAHGAGRSLSWLSISCSRDVLLSLVVSMDHGGVVIINK
jgi:hypothetical protein